jgi:hypothetical protein
VKQDVEEVENHIVVWAAMENVSGKAILSHVHHGCIAYAVAT